MSYIAPEVIAKAKEMDLLTYLKNYEPSELVRFSRNTYCTRTHDSLKISNGKWMWWSQGIGGKSALDYLIKVRGLSFVEAVESIVGKVAVRSPVYVKQSVTQPERLLLPQKSPSNTVIKNYLLSRGIDSEIIDYCIQKELIFESLPYHNIIFIGYDNEGVARYGAYRATNRTRILGDVTGSNKHYSFRLTNDSADTVHLFECAIDLLSFATLLKQKGEDWKSYNLLSLSGVYMPKVNIEESKVPVALTDFLTGNSRINKIVLHLDRDKTGRFATKALQVILPKSYEIIDAPAPYGKDFNDFLCYKKGLTHQKTNEERSFER